MKLCALGLRGIPNVMGGVETHCEQLYPRVAALDPGLEIVVLARAPYVDRAVSSHRGVRVRPIWAVRNPYLEAILHSLWGVLHARFVERASLVHVHAVGPGLAIPLARLVGLRVVFTHHGEDYRREKWNRFARLALRLGETVAVRLAHRTIVVSRSVAASLAERHPSRAARIGFIPNGAAIEPTASPGRDEAVLGRFGLEAGRFVMTVGRLVPEKNIHDLVAAFRSLTPEARAGRKLAVVGAAQGLGAYAERLRAEAGADVVFTGQLPRDEIGALYRGAQLFVLASSHEGLPIAALEALAAGAPALLSDIPPNLDIGLPAASYTPVGDVPALAARLAVPSTVPAVDAGAIAARYDWDRIAADTARVLRDAAERPNAPDPAGA